MGAPLGACRRRHEGQFGEGVEEADGIGVVGSPYDLRGGLGEGGGDETREPVRVDVHARVGEGHPFRLRGLDADVAAPSGSGVAGLDDSPCRMNGA